MPDPAPSRRPGPPAALFATLGGFVFVALLAALPPVSPAQDPVAPALGRVYACQPGPWGEMEYSRIVIEPPDEFMASDYIASPTVWIFPGYDAPRLEQLWRQAALDEDQLRALRDPSRRATNGAGISLRPDDTLVRSLDREARAVIYNTLAGLPGNSLQSEPFRFRAEMVDEWFEESGVDETVLQQVRRLLYPRGSSLLFSDPGLVLPLLPSAADRVRLVKMLARKSTLLLKVRIRPDANIDEIAAYWSSGKRRKDVKPLLHSLSRHQGGMTIDVVHLLPRFARGLLYTYPAPDTPGHRAPDCHWTSMNFFNDPPDPRFEDIAYLKEVLLTDYIPVTGTAALGDLLILTRADGEVIHSCVYLADEIVFTKNGSAAMVPWTLTTLRDLQASYPAQPELEVRVFRRQE